MLGTCFLYALTGCRSGSESSVPVIPQYNTEIKTGSSKETSEVSDIKSENGFYPEEQEQPIVSPNKDDLFEGFSGIADLSDTPKLGNTQQNLTGSTSYCGIICKNDNDTYYTALGYDNYLHKKSGGKDEIFLESTVWGLNIIGGQMYCIMNSEKPVQNLPPYSHGDIYRVDLDTGEISLVLATRACALAAMENKLCFVYDNGLNDTFYNRVYEYDLDSGNIVRLNGAFLGFIGEYYIGFDQFGQNSCIINNATGDKVRFTDSNMVYNFTTDNGYCYYQSGGSGFYRLNPENGETAPMMPDDSFKRITINYSDGNSDVFETNALFIGGHYIFNGNAYIVDQEFAFKVTPDNETEIYHTTLNSGDGWYYECLFGDGERLYSVKTHLNKKQYKLVELQFTDEEYAEGIKTVKEIDLL